MNSRDGREQTASRTREAVSVTDKQLRCAGEQEAMEVRTVLQCEQPDQGSAGTAETDCSPSSQQQGSHATGQHTETSGTWGAEHLDCQQSR